jgi:tRNA(Ile)-lysidine synthase
MRAEVERTIRNEGMLAVREPVWVAVSGGVDSMVLLHVLRHLGHPCHVLHVDHGLRGMESDGDRTFVETFCRQERLPFEALRVDVAATADREGISIQMAARDLRYAWFNEKAGSGPHKVALGHHRDDAVETLMVHLLRGPGTAGWSGIAPMKGPFIRPLIQIPRADIQAYAEARNIPFRADSSNAEVKYLRNRLRHDVLPLLDRIRPGATGVMGRSLGLFREMEAVTKAHVNDALSQVEVLPDGTRRLSLERAGGGRVPRSVLHAWLAPLGFHPRTQEQVLGALREGRVGAEFVSGDHWLVVDRDCLLLAPVPKGERSWVLDLSGPLPADAPVTASFHDVAEMSVAEDKHVAWFDLDRMQGPFQLRTWRKGDRMRPIGLGGSKLVSDLLIDAKVPRVQKDSTLVLTGPEGILWLVGHRVAEGRQAGPDTRRVVRLIATP